MANPVAYRMMLSGHSVMPGTLKLEIDEFTRSAHRQNRGREAGTEEQPPAQAALPLQPPVVRPHLTQCRLVAREKLLRIRHRPENRKETQDTSRSPRTGGNPAPKAVKPDHAC